MQFNSFAFAVFFPVVFALYWLAGKKGPGPQNVLLLAGGYVFYGWWDRRFLLLLIALSLTNYLLALRIERSPRRRKLWLAAGLAANIGALAVFKYAGFFVDGLRKMLSLVGYDLPGHSVDIILPLGISFYTFMSMSYLFDVYRRAFAAHRNAVEALLALSFFPVILAGPIQRPSSLLPQIAGRREFRYGRAADGARQVLWGLFAKAAVADHLARIVDDIFSNAPSYPGSTLAVGALLFAVQIYADFSGYSNIAVGIGKLLGFELMRNFSYPYFSRNIKEFWRKWHISLTSWFRDYVFLPLSYSISRRIKPEKILFLRSDVLIYAAASLSTWLLTGLWHGASSTFILWGALNGAFLVVHHLQMKPRKTMLARVGMTIRSPLIVAVDVLLTLLLIMVLWVFFRADSAGAAFSYLGGIFSGSLLSPPEFGSPSMAVLGLFLSAAFLFIEWLGRDKEHGLAGLGLTWRRPLRWALYHVVILAVFLFGGGQKPFIYFRF